MKGEFVDFVVIDHLPVGAKKIAEIPETFHTFYKRGDRLFMQNCIGNILEVDNPEGYDYELISQDFENLPDPWGIEQACSRRKR